MKRTIVVMLLLTLIGTMSIQMTGCSGPVGEEKAIKVDDLEIIVEPVIVDGDREMAFKYVNNSSFTIEEVDLAYAFKKDIEADIVKKVFGEDFEEEGYTLADLFDITIDATCTGEVAPSEKSPNGEFEYGVITKKEQLDLLEPSILTIKYVVDNKLYTEYYDYMNDSYSVEEEIIDLAQWGTTDIANKVPRPEGAMITYLDESDSGLDFDAINFTKEDFKAYVKLVKDAGFTKVSWEYNGSYDASTSDDKFDISISLDEDDNKLVVYADKN